MSSRCTGHCCRRFTIDLGLLTHPEARVVEGDYIRDMVVPLEPTEDDDDRWYCTCRHFDGRDCTAYESRPPMCKDYPYGRSCTYDGCTLKEREHAQEEAAASGLAGD